MRSNQDRIQKQIDVSLVQAISKVSMLKANLSMCLYLCRSTSGVNNIWTGVVAIVVETAKTRRLIEGTRDGGVATRADEDLIGS